MTSIKRQLPYDYYSLPFCKPPDGKLHYKPENLGEILRGDRIVNTPYEVGGQYSSHGVLTKVDNLLRWP